MVPGWLILTISSVMMDWWRIYLKIRNVKGIYKSREAPLGIRDLMTVDDYKKFRKNQLDSNIIATVHIVAHLSVNLLKWSYLFDEFLWEFTAVYSSSSSVRVNLLVIFDRFLGECSVSPISVYMTWRRSSYRMNIGKIFFRTMWNIMFKTIKSGSLAFLYIQLTDRLGVLTFPAIITFSITVGIHCYIAYIAIILPYISEPLKDDEFGQSIKTQANGLGYPHDKIRVTIAGTSKKQDVYYCKLLGYEMIIVARRLFRILLPIQVTALVTTELGHWKFRHESLSLIFDMIYYLGYCCALVLSYGNETISAMFGFEESEYHPYLPVYITTRYIWPMGEQFVKWFRNLFRRSCVFQADDFASDKGLTAPLRTALLVTAAYLKNRSLYDSWHSAWVHGEPTIQERISRLSKRLPKNNVAFEPDPVHLPTPVPQDSSEESSSRPYPESTETEEPKTPDGQNRRWEELSHQDGENEQALPQEQRSRPNSDEKFTNEKSEENVTTSNYKNDKQF